MGEIWKDIPEFLGVYQVSNLGRVRSLDRINAQGRFAVGKVLKSRIGKQGYPYVILKFGQKQRTLKVHRLVAKAFIENPYNFPMINHKDEDKTNNIVSNLEWCDAKYNVNYGGGIERAASKTREPVAQMDIDGRIIAIYPGFNVAQQKTGVSESKISMCCSGKRKSAGGFKWKKVQSHEAAIQAGVRSATVYYIEGGSI